MFRATISFLIAIAAGTLFAQKPNVLIITVDDMSADSVGAFGCALKDTTPNMDRLAAGSMRFHQAHSVVGNCMPSRNVMWSGRYPHNNKIEGFYEVKDVKYPVMCDLMKSAGYYTGIRHKVSHSTPWSPYAWDMILDTAPDGSKPDVKAPASYRTSFEQGLHAAKEAGKPFCLLLNIADPHKPFYAEGKGGGTVPDKNVPSRVFTPEEVPVPGFLPDDLEVRKELAHYYSSVRRADDAVGAIMDGLNASGEAGRTIIIFLSDHGMPLPFAKTQLYHHSTRTPLMILWPGITKAGTVDDLHMVSTVDLLPTLLDMVNVSHPPGFDGRSFAPLLKGEKQDSRDMIFKEHNENAGGQRTPMRAVQTKDYLYVFSPWSNGTRIMSGATAGTSTFRQMRLQAKSDAQIAARVDLFNHRVPEEAYEVRYDPDALTNLIDNPAHAAQVDSLEKAMEDWMVRTRDPLLEVFRHRNDPAFREAFMVQIEKEAAANRRQKRSENDEGDSAPSPRQPMVKSSPGKASAAALKAPQNLIQLGIPKSVKAGSKTVITVKYTLPPDLGEKPLQVTLKDGSNGRIERQTFKIIGEGSKEVTFAIPAGVPGGKVIFAGLVGDSIKNALQHWQSKPVPVQHD